MHTETLTLAVTVTFTDQSRRLLCCYPAPGCNPLLAIALSPAQKGTGSPAHDPQPDCMELNLAPSATQKSCANESVLKSNYSGLYRKALPVTLSLLLSIS